VATLGEDGKLALAQRPPIDLIDVWPVASEAQMLALADATAGDFAVRSDNGWSMCCNTRLPRSLPTGWRSPPPRRSPRSTARSARWHWARAMWARPRRGGRSARKARCWAAAAR
jgi:hypothetical protein